MSDTENVLSLPLAGKQESNRLPLALNVVALYWGEEIQTSGHVKDGQRGAEIMDGIELLESHGLSVYTYQSSIRDLKKKISQRIPPIVIMPGIRGTVQHASIISGFDSIERRILTYVPEPDAVGAIPESKFEQEWKQDNYCVLIVVPDELKKVLEKDEMRFKDSNRAYFECERAWQKGKSLEVKSRLRQLVKTDSGNPQLWCLLGSVYNDLSSEEAIECYQRAIELNDSYYLAFRGLGNYFLKVKDYAKAVDFYSKAIGINSQRFAPIYKNRAICCIELGKTEDAKQDLQIYLQQMPDASDASSIRSALLEI